MFEDLSNNLSKVFESLTRRGSLSEKDVKEALREIRIVLLESDVSLSVVTDFLERVGKKAIGEKVLRSVTPGQMIIKIVNEELVNILTHNNSNENNLVTVGKKPISYLLLGLQGVGKTTTIVKIAKYLRDQEDKKILMASLDIYRPAAIEQLDLLAQSVGLQTIKARENAKPLEIINKALGEAERLNFDFVLFDTAGRTVIDDKMMKEISMIYERVAPKETLLVADAMMGQDSAIIAKTFQKTVNITGIVLTRVDGDSRGGAALSMVSSTGVPIKLLGVGESLASIEKFNPEKIARRILGMGDIVDLVDKASDVIDKEDAQKIESKIKKGQFDLDDLLLQVRQLKKMGGIQGIMNYLPKLGSAGKKLKALNSDDKALVKQEAILLSMTPQERRQPSIIKASRKKRIASGSGTVVSEVNRVLKQYQQMNAMMKKMSKLQGSGMPGNLSGGLGDFQGLNNLINKNLN